MLKFTFKNCGSVFSTYFYDVRNIGYSCVSITERKGSALLRRVFSKCDGSCDRATYDICSRTDEDMGYYANSEMIRNMLQGGVTPEEEAFLTKEFAEYKRIILVF